jgi:putative lipase involved disintegration of autophagic bodies
MKRTRILLFALAVMLAITSTGLIASAQQSTLNLSDTQALRIQALISSQTREMRSLYVNVQAAQEALSAAVAKGDPVVTATAVLSLDAAEKALKNTQLANQRNLLSLLNEYQKQVVRDYSAKTIPASE